MIGGMTVSSTPLETLLAQAHAQPGEPQSRLSELLSALEDADWTLLLGTQEALAAQLASLLGPGLIRLDPRLSVNRETFAAFGVALASSDGDWKGARAVWLLEPDERALTRARRADVPVIVDATLAPGGRWLAQGAQFVVYRDAATLTGLGDVALTAVSGLGSRPRRVASGPADLSVALALRDIGTLALRMNRRTRNTEALLPRFEGRALPVSGGVLLLEHDGPSTVTPLGGNLSAARAVPAGTLVTVGIESPDDAWTVLGAVLMGEAQPAVQEAGQTSAAAQTGDDEQTGSEPDRSAAPTFRPERKGGDRAPEARLPEPAVPAALPPGPMPVEPSQTEVARPEAVSAEPDPAQQSHDSASEDYSDREFVFSPPPVLPDLPSLPNVVTLPSLPTASLPEEQDDGRPAPKRNRGRRGKGQDAAQPSTQPAVQPEIVMSESFSRPPQSSEPERALELQRPEGTSAPEVSADQWPEEVEGDDTLLDTAPAVSLPLQLPPDLPVDSQAAPTDGLTDEQQAIYARLREWRNAEAKRQTVSSFIIASNATLAEVARRVPYTEADLKAVKGMGPERLRKYGEKILEVVRG